MQKALEHDFPLQALAALERLGDNPAISTFSSDLSGATLARIIRGFARRLERFGVDRHTTVVIGFENGVHAFIAAISASLLGATWAMHDDHLPFRLLANVRVVSDPKLRVKNYPHAIADRSWFSGTDSNGSPFPGYSDPNDIFAVAPSSGTTGTPKYMRRSVGSLGVEFEVTRRIMSGPADSGNVVSIRFPVRSYVGFTLILGSLLNGARLVLPGPGDKLAGEFTRLLESGVMHVLGSPTQVAGLLACSPPPEKRMKTLLAGGAIITPKMLRSWLTYFETVLLGYGSRESACIGFCSFTRSEDARDLAYEMEGHGEFQVVDHEHRPVPDGQSGTLRFRRPYMVTSYLGAPEADAEVFRDGWFYPGDLGHIDEQRRVHITGRMHDQINLGGIKFNAAAVDSAAAAVVGVEAAMCFATERSDGVNELRLCLCLSPGATLAATEKAVRDAVRAAVKAGVAAIYEVQTIPANENGKPLRSHGPALTASLVPV